MPARESAPPLARPVLGRGVVVGPGDPVPDAWGHSPEIVIDETAALSPAAVVAELHEAWLRRRPTVVRLVTDPDRFREPASLDVEPWTVDAAFEPWGDRLHFLVWANTYDGRGGKAPVWWWARKAERLGARPASGEMERAGDVVLPDGTIAWIDGGPRGPVDDEVEGAVVVHAESVELGRLEPAPPAVAPAAELAPDQLAAVAHGAGPARVIAPAGSGKTRVLTERLRHLLGDRGYERDLVLAVAYNVKAQQELQLRCTDFRPRVQTLNALAYGVLSRAVGSRPRVLEEREIRRIIARLVPLPKQRRANVDPIAPYMDALSAVRLGLRNPDEVEAERDDVPGLAAAFQPYREALAAESAVDFDEQVYGAVRALLADGAFRRREQSTCRHLLVDEFQDLTPAHVLLIRLLALPTLDVFGVGDDDQVIYGYMGADPGFLIRFGELFTGAHHHALEVNYRCPEAVVGAARTLLSYNHRRVAKEIRHGPTAVPGDEPLVARRHAPDEGAAVLAELVADWLSDESVEPRSVAVLTRVNSLLLAPQVALSEAGIPLASSLRAVVLERTGVRAALAYVRIATSPTEIAPGDVAEILRRPSRGLPQWFGDRLRRRRRWTLESLRAIAGSVPDRVADKVHDLVDDLALVVDVAARSTTAEVLCTVRDDVGLGAAMSLLDESKGGEMSSHVDDLEALVQVAAHHPAPASFESWLGDVLARPEDPEGVTLSTVHRVKGMEWDRVAVFGVTAGIVPHRLATDLEEERRILHVAITRGRHRVAVLADARRPSRFLDELTGAAPHRSAPEPRRVRERPTAVVSGAADALEEALRAWRLERSRRDNVPAYVVLHDRTVRAIATARPTSLAALRRVDGIGPTKLERYGEEILEVVAASPRG